jgi:hypothetical protein
MKIIKTWISLLQKNKWIALAALGWLVQFWIVFSNEPIESTKFLPKVISLVFISINVNLAVFLACFFIFKKTTHRIWKSLAISAALSLGAIILALFFKEQYAEIGVYLNYLVVETLIGLRFVKVSVIDGNLFWTVMLAAYVGLALMIYGNWFSGRKQEGETKVERTLLWTGLGVYGVTSAFVFVFTHFTFVGSNYLYIEKHARVVHQTIQTFEAKGKKVEDLKGLHYFPNLSEAVDFFTEPTRYQQNTSTKNKQEFYDTALNKLKSIEHHGFQDSPTLVYDKIERFHDWVQISYNFSFNKESKAQQTAWYSEITPTVGDAKAEAQERLRHSMMYVAKSKQGGYYVMVTLDRTFKDFKVNYIFNLFFILFHVFYIGFFVWLMNVHRHKNLKQSQLKRTLS